MKKNTNYLLIEAEKLYNGGYFYEVTELLTNEILEIQNSAELYAWRSRTNHRLGKDVATNMVLAEKAITLDPNYFMGYFVRALIRADRNEFNKAIKDYTKAIELNLDFADAFYNRGISWQNLDKKDKAFADFDKAIENYEKAIEINPKDVELYIWNGNAWYNKKNDHDKMITYENAIKNYNKAIDINPNYPIAFYNKAQAEITKKEYENALKDLNKVIDLEPEYAEAYVSRGNLKRIREDFDGAIEDYTQVMSKKLNDRNAYYYRGLTYYTKALNKIKIDIDLLSKSRDDFKKYLDLTVNEQDIGIRYAKYYLKKLDEKEDSALTKIIKLVLDIKNILYIKELCITHYTSLSTMKKLILADNCKLRLSEGNFMNDPSEGTELFSFLNFKDKNIKAETTEIETFAAKPFIGSFVTENKHNDLNMWRFYGKENQIEAKGCAIVLRMQEFLDDIKNSISNEKNKDARIDDESDINFYRVVYLTHKSTDFRIPYLDDNKVEEFKRKMTLLKKKVDKYCGTNNTNLKEYLNNIAFLFKRADYVNENEIRLVMTGIEFEKKFYEENKEDQSINPPRVYIELVPIRKRVKQITLGPKVDKANEWSSALHYSYKEEEKVPKIMISHLPYK